MNSEEYMSKLDFFGGNKVEEAILEKLEAELEVVFPESYRSMILEHNGTYVDPSAYRASNRVESINNFFDINKTYEFFNELLPSKLVPIGRDGGDNLICLDFRQEGRTPVLFWDYEIEEIREGTLSFVADSFEEFLDMLFDFEE